MCGASSATSGAAWNSHRIDSKRRISDAARINGHNRGTVTGDDRPVERNRPQSFGMEMPPAAGIRASEQV